MINVRFDKNNYLCLNESYQKTRKNMKTQDLIDKFAKGEMNFKKFCEDLKGEKTTNTDLEEKQI